MSKDLLIVDGNTFAFVERDTPSSLADAVRAVNGFPALPLPSSADDSAPAVHAGISTCPVCARRWWVTPGDDCFLPGCGCFGDDAGPSNPARPCGSCGAGHIATCAKGDNRG